MVPLVVGMVVVLLVGAVAAVVVFTRSGSDHDSFHLEAANAETVDAYTASAVASGWEQPSNLPNVIGQTTGNGSTDKELTVAEAFGDLRNLYATAGADTDDEHEAPRLCDKDELRRSLLGEGRRGAWMRDMGESGSVQDVLDTLTPVMLGMDTTVREYHYSPDEPAPYDAILQAGTVVLIDDNAQPRVRCASGNPLASPELESSGQTGVLVGERWPGFDPTNVVLIRQAPGSPLEALDFVFDVETDDSVRVPLDSPDR